VAEEVGEGEETSPFRTLVCIPMMRPLLFCLLASSLSAADWPTYRGDASRSGYSAETIPNQLRQRWEFRLPAAPKPAWPTSDRMEYDLAFQPIIVGDLVLFGSSADDQVYALDAMTGRIRWRFFSEGPVRFRPGGVEGPCVCGE
jgi:outer membrane protein assembly factor BamB